MVRYVFEHGFHGLHGLFLRTWSTALDSVMRRSLNTDYTDAFYGDVDIPWSSVVR